ncbi:MAG: YcaO-like family protein [Eubacteriales bacterium]|nr:YcaO-like family protein [Eubacteriales bacterium]
MKEPFQAPVSHKAVPPYATVRRVRELLAGLDVFTVETFHTPAYRGAACSCRLELGDAPFLGAGYSVNGKGMSPRWALASAYGEFMERLECGELLPGYPGEPGDSGEMPVDLFARECPEAFVFGMGLADREALADFLRSAFPDGFIRCVPFTGVGDCAQIPLPERMIRDLCGTTGLCAGNTRDEAMMQGLMEIFERYATRKLYQFRLTPPEVPESLFEGTEVLHRLRALGLQYSIRDCSLGKAFPVVGLALTLPDGRRTIRLGAAASPVIALERCLTEVYQGTPGAAEHRFRQPGILDANNKQQLFAEYCDTISTGSGAWLDCAFDGEPSYPFAGFGRTVFENDSRALRYFIDLASQFGGRLFARDCSQLGFPAYRLYMPGASEAFLNFTLTREDYVLWQRLCRHRETVFHLPRASGTELEALASAVLAARKALMPISRDPLAWLAGRAVSAAAEGVFFPLLFGATGRYALAAEEMIAYLETPASNEGPRRYLKALVLFWQALADGTSPVQAADSVASAYGQALANRCLAGLNATPFEREDWPVCPDCAQCALRGRCTHSAAAALSAQLAEKTNHQQEEQS